MGLKSNLGRCIPAVFKRRFHEATARRSIRPLFGRTPKHLGENSVVVTCLVKNGQFYIEAFLRHHLNLGVDHIFLLDNGSTDGTLEIAQQYSSVSAFRTCMPVGSYQKVLKRTFASIVAANCWCLDLDIDEFFEYPGRNVASMPDLLAYLNQHGFTAMVTQMLDMFPSTPLDQLSVQEEPDLQNIYRQYNLLGVREEPYQRSGLGRQFAANNTSAPGHPLPPLLFGGIRKQLYGLDCLLTKHALFRQDGHLEAFPHVHFMNCAHIADVTGVLFHYKFTANAAQLAKQNAEAFHTNRRGYDDFLFALAADPSLSCIREGARELISVESLVEEKFLHVGSAYQQYLRSKAEHGS